MLKRRFEAHGLPGRDAYATAGTDAPHALVQFRKALREKAHSVRDTYFRTTYLTDWDGNSSIEGLKCLCGRVFKDGTGEHQLWLHVTCDDGAVSVHEQEYMEKTAPAGGTITSYFVSKKKAPAAPAPAPAPAPAAPTSAPAPAARAPAAADFIEAPRLPCAGWPLPYPDATSVYPFAHHGEAQLPWRAYAEGPLVRIQALAHGAASGCATFYVGDDGACSECLAISRSSRFREIEARILDPERVAHSSTKDAFCSHQILALRRNTARDRANRNYLSLMNTSRKVQSLTKALTLRDRLVALLRTKDVPKLRLVLDVALRNRASLTTVINRVAEAIEGEYRPNGNSEDDYHLATLVLRIGGPKLLFAVSRAMGLPSRSSWSEPCPIPTRPPIVIATGTGTTFLPLCTSRWRPILDTSRMRCGGICWRSTLSLGPIESAV